MGLFKRKSMAERQAEAMEMADNIAQGKGFMGKMTQSFMGREFTEAMQGANASMHQAQQAQALAAAGVPTQQATVTNLQDTGQTINDNPNVAITVDLDGQPATLVTLVSRLQIPRIGDSILVLRDPGSGALLYAGLAPRT